MTEYITITSEGIKRKPDLVPGDASILKEVMPYFDFYIDNNDNAIAVSNLLIEAMQRFGGIGLSANQIGVRERCFVMEMNDNIVAFFNPEIVDTSTETQLQEEGCLSYPGLNIKIRRPTKVMIHYQSYDGKHRQLALEGIMARITQHETDHLNGLTFMDRAGPLALKMAKKKWSKK